MKTHQSSIIEILPQIFRQGRKKSKKILEESVGYKVNEEIIYNTDSKKYKNQVYHLDNLNTICHLLNTGYEGTIDLIYIDPPFLTMANYKSRIRVLNNDKVETIEHIAYKDNWEGGIKEYLENLFPRLYLMRKLLSNEGTIYVHLDYRIVHYVKIMMDYIFGEERFINEIIWSYKSGGVSKRYYSRKHDTILMYTKTENYIFNPQKEKSYNRGFKPYNFKNVREYEDDIGWYTLVNLKDVWNINIVGRTSRERVGYGTQKPEKLLERIIHSSSRKDSIVADFFAGSGTTGIVADKLGRKFIMGDKSNLSCLTIMKRIAENKGSTYKLYKQYENQEVNKLYIEEFISKKVNDGKGLLKIKLAKYELNLDLIKLSSKDIKIVESILFKDSLAVIDYIGIDYNYNRINPNIKYEDYRKEGYYRINNEIEIPIHEELVDKPVYLKVVDIFGNELSKILE